jgi:A/G-specific adenine glycosylase
MDSVVALIEDTRTAEKAVKLTNEFIEYIDSMDYNKYFDAIPTKTLTGAQNAQYSEFSGKALAVAQAKLDAFLSLLPAQALADAESQMIRL